MPDPLFDIDSSPAIDRFYDELGEDDQAELGRIVTLLRLNPWPDDVLKFEYGSLLAYDDTEWAILYRVVGQIIQLMAAWNRRLGLPRRGPNEL